MSPDPSVGNLVTKSRIPLFFHPEEGSGGILLIVIKLTHLKVKLQKAGEAMKATSLETGNDNNEVVDLKFARFSEAVMAGRCL